jgi:hypothetical protein
VAKVGKVFGGAKVAVGSGRAESRVRQWTETEPQTSVPTDDEVPDRPVTERSESWESQICWSRPLRGDAFSSPDWKNDCRSLSYERSHEHARAGMLN